MNTINNTQHGHQRNKVTLSDIIVKAPELHPMEQPMQRLKVHVPLECFFKIHPDIQVTVALSETGDESWYLLSKHIADNYAKKLWNISYATLYLCQKEDGEIFLLPKFAKAKQIGDKEDSLQEAIDYSLDGHLVNLSYDAPTDSYCFGGSSYPEEEWPTETLDEILDAAFPGDLYIDSVESPIIRKYLRNVDLMAKVD